MSINPRPQPYRLDPPPDTEPGLAQIITNADEMFQQVFEDIAALDADSELAINTSGTDTQTITVFGLPGADGADGAASYIPGVAGPIGPTGLPGFPGLSGQDGENGAMGPPGVAGAAGVAGADGVAGTIGPPGRDGDDADSYPLPLFTSPNIVGCIVYRGTGNQTIADGTVGDTFYPVDFDTDEFDTASMHDTGSNISRIQIPVGGLYLITYEGLFSASATGQRVVRIRKNGTTDLIGGGFFAGNPNATWSQSVVVSSVYLLAAGDYVEVMVYQNSGGNLTLYGSGAYYASRASVMKVG